MQVLKININGLIKMQKYKRYKKQKVKNVLKK